MFLEKRKIDVHRILACKTAGGVAGAPLWTRDCMYRHD